MPITDSSAPAPRIICTSQQSRFHAETLDTSLDVDLKDVSISIEQNELVEASHLRLKAGVRYALVARNGAGKSTLMRAIADKLIPGLSVSLRVLMLSQVEDTIRGQAAEASVLEHVLQGDEKRVQLLERQKQLMRAIDSNSALEASRIVMELRLEGRKRELLEAQKIATRRSGARGKDARALEIEAEQGLKEAYEALANLSLDSADAAATKTAAEMLADVEVALNLVDAASAESRAASILLGLGFSQAMMARPYKTLSGGWRSRCALATALLVSSDLLLLDEPTNFLDLEATLWLEGFLESQPKTLVVTSHDVAFLDAVAEETVTLRFRKLHYFEGTPSAMEVQHAKEARHVAAQQKSMDKRKQHIEKSIAQGKSAAKKSGDDNKLRMAKSRQKKLDERWGVEKNAKGHRFKLQRDMSEWSLTYRQALVVEQTESLPHIIIPSAAPLRTRGDLIHFDAIGVTYKGASKPLLDNVTFTVSQGSRVAFLGANGEGKSTIAKLIAGKIPASRGQIVRHPQLTVGYFSQHSVEALSTAPEVGSSQITALSYFLKHFADKGEKIEESEARQCLGAVGLQGKVAASTPLVQLSGGQKVRLALALVVFKPPHLLLLDEVTTHIDAPTIEALASALRKFEGAVVLITHDRWFSRVVVEGASYRALRREHADAVSGDESASESEDERAEDVSPGKTYFVGGGQVKELPRGMVQYVEMVERKLSKRQAQGK